jgi:hypothetical protein
MADPFTAATAASTGLQAVGGIMKAFGGRDEAEAKAREREYKAGIARQNAAFNRQNAEWATESGEQAARRSGLTTGFTIGKQKTAQAASGFDVNAGTAVDVRESQRAAGLEDQTSIRTTAARKAVDFRNKAVSDEAEADSEIRGAAAARKSGKFNMFSTLLGTATGVADKWTQWSKVGAPATSGITTYDENFLPVSFTAT